MKVLYDFQSFMQVYGGLSRYPIDLINHFTNEIEPILPNILSDNVYLAQVGWKHHSIIKKNHAPWKYNIYKVFNILQSIGYLQFKDFDVFHPLFCRPYFIGYTNKPVVLTMHDLNFDKFPDMLPNSETVIRRERAVCNRADAIIAISNETKLDLIKYHNIDESKIKVVYHGMNQDLIQCKKSRLHSNDYILYIGGRRGYKNFEAFVKAFANLKNPIDLVCTGGALNSSELLLINKLGISDRFFQQFVSDEELYNLLYYATAFVYPSLGEGFGRPILEAYRCSCPCIVSDLMCFHEVAGDAAEYFNPREVESITYAIDHVISDSARQNDLRKKGLIQLKKFTWEETARKTTDIYKSLV